MYRQRHPSKGREFFVVHDLASQNVSRSGSLGRVRAMRLLLLVVCGSAIVATTSVQALAAITVANDVWLSPDAGTGNYGGLYFAQPPTGIPQAGNEFDDFGGADDQVTFEGRESADGLSNVNFSILVGRSSSGELDIVDAILRDMDLVIGDTATINGVLRQGRGTVRIESGGVYNNNPDIITPYPGMDPDNPVSPSVVPRPDEVGYDLYVGRNGFGNLSISIGGIAEIQDAVIVGDENGSDGTLTIDGSQSYLQSGGFQTTSIDPDEVNYMIIGRFGTGRMFIKNGGQSYNLGPTTTLGTTEVFGAVIGSAFAAVDADPPPASGDGGSVYVDGDGSTWTVGGTLQVGGFHNNRTGSPPVVVDDLDGNEAVYLPGTGGGYLSVTNNGVVNIITPPLEPGATNVPDRVDVLVGRDGIIDLNGGKIVLKGAFDTNDPNNPSQELNSGRLVNDGIVMGHGSISVLQFRNRVLGRVSVGDGQRLLISSTGAYNEADNVPTPTEPEYPLSNYGVVDVLGTETARAEIEFRRSPGSTSAPLTEPRPFLNLPAETMPLAPNGRTEGLIHGEYSTMRFDSGLWNRGVLAFTAGNNVVSGDVVSFGESAPGADDRGRVLIGPDTNVAFEDDFFTFGVTQISPGASFQVLKGSSFAVGGTFSISVNATESGLSFDPFPIAGDASFSGDLQVSILGALNPMANNIVPIINVGGDIMGNFSTVTPSGIPFGSTIDMFTFVFGQQLYLASFDFSMANGADLNGDGLVDTLDYAIWKQNFGRMGTPGAPLAGDTNGDGRVDALDYTVWRDACGVTCAVTGSGASFGLGGITTVPEPTSCMLLASVGLAAFVFGRHRAS